MYIFRICYLFCFGLFYTILLFESSGSGPSSFFSRLDVSDLLTPNSSFSWGASTAFFIGSVETPCAQALTKGYTQSLHIAAIFIVFATSITGATLPLFVKRLASHLDNVYLSCGKLFGAGVILATGFIHMFPTADQVRHPVMIVAGTMSFIYSIFILYKLHKRGFQW